MRVSAHLCLRLYELQGIPSNLTRNLTLTLMLIGDALQDIEEEVRDKRGDWRGAEVHKDVETASLIVFEVAIGRQGMVGLWRNELSNVP